MIMVFHGTGTRAQRNPTIMVFRRTGTRAQANPRPTGARVLVESMKVAIGAWEAGLSAV
jgi:hypothetical protein